MFEITGADNSVTLRASFWQAIKLGAGFSLGAILVAIPLSLLMYAVWFRVLLAVLTGR